MGDDGTTPTPTTTRAASASRSVSERLGDYVCDLRFEDLPNPVVDKAKELLVHHVGLALRAGEDPSRRSGVQAAHYLSGSAEDCTVIGEIRGATVLDAVFANSLLMGHRGMDDFQLPSGIHQGVVTYPVALAFGERTHSPGREVITAVVAGYDVYAKLSHHVFGYNMALPRQSYTLFGAFGAVAVAARLLNLSREQSADAMAHAAHVGAGLIEAGSLMQPLTPIVARNGAMVAVLARAGIPMTRTSIEGDHGLFRSYTGQAPETLDDSLATLGQSFEIMKASVKRYGGSGLNIVPQELTLALMNTNALAADDITSVDVTLPEERGKRENLMESRLSQTSERSTWSARFLIASVVASRTIDPTRHERTDPELGHALDKVRLRYEPGRPMRYCRVEISTNASTRYVAEGDDHVFPPVDPTTWLAEGGRRVLSDHRLNRLVELIDNLDSLADLAELTACLVPDKPAEEAKK